jgi:hypothetical protein
MSIATLRLALVALALAWACASAPATAASALANMPIGTGATYHVTTQTNKPALGGGSSSTNNVVHFKRVAMTAINVSVNGEQAGQITLDASGNPLVPAALKTIMAPFGLVGILMRGAPQPLAPNSSWSANVPIPLDGNTVNIPAVVGVSNYSANGGSVAANGHSSTSVRPMFRQKPTDIAFTAMMHFNAAHVLSSASSNVAMTINAGRLRTQHAGSSFTLTLTGP